MDVQTILVTGISGINIETCLQNFINDNELFNIRFSQHKPYLIKFETEIENSYYELNPSVSKNNQVWKHIILHQSYPKLEILWDKAFYKVKQKIEHLRSEQPNLNIIINLHSCYYHNRTQEYLSLINLEKIQSFSPTKIITLIDDIYEIHHRLTQLGGIFHDESNPSNTQMILRLLRLLDWRANESMMSRFIATNLNIKNYIFAVKHSYETLFNLMFSEYPKIYLSHPITEVRRLEKQQLHEEVSAIMKEITVLSEILKLSYTTFLPTTIDEFRINSKPSRDAYSKDYFAILTKRWEDTRYAQPSRIVYTSSGFRDVDRLWYKNEDELTRFDEQINHLLEALSDTISDQVTIRDYSLVEQSDMIVIYRPIFNGNASGGVREEFNYYKRLNNDLGREIKCFIYCPQEDINKYYIRQFVLKLQGEIENGESLICRGEKFTNLLTTECEKLLESVTDPLMLLDIFDLALQNHQVEFLIRNSKTPLAGDKILEFKHKFIDGLLKAFQSIEDYKKDVTYFEEKEISVELFVSNIQQIINN